MRYFSLVLLLLSFSSTAFAHEVGDVVVVIAESSAKILADNGVATTVRRGDVHNVNIVKGDLLWVVWKRKSGWIESRAEIEFDKAIDFFTAAIKTIRNRARNITRAECCGVPRVNLIKRLPIVTKRSDSIRKPARPTTTVERYCLAFENTTKRLPISTRYPTPAEGCLRLQ